MTIFLGETIRIKCTMKDYDGSLFTPDSQEVKIYDPNGVLKETNISPILESEGVYHINYTIGENETVGDWKCIWKATKNDLISIEECAFNVRELVK
jgi:uncharacterized protein YfaS (alpha-2-macroglobulin family)